MLMLLNFIIWQVLLCMSEVTHFNIEFLAKSSQCSRSHISQCFRVLSREETYLTAHSNCELQTKWPDYCHNSWGISFFNLFPSFIETTQRTYQDINIFYEHEIEVRIVIGTTDIWSQIKEGGEMFEGKKISVFLRKENICVRQDNLPSSHPSHDECIKTRQLLNKGTKFNFKIIIQGIGREDKYHLILLFN